MIKKLSIVVVCIALTIGGIAVWLKTRPIDEQKEVLGETITLNTENSKPDSSFGEEGVSQTITPTAVPTEIIKKGPYTMEINIKKSYEAILKTSMGDITITLFASATPITVNNFVVLSRKSFYTLIIYRIY